MSEEKTEENTQEQLKEIFLTKEESKARDVLVEAGYAVVTKENSLGQKVEVQINVIQFMADVIQKFKGL